jgi:hypothetical protein
MPDRVYNLRMNANYEVNCKGCNKIILVGEYKSFEPGDLQTVSINVPPDYGQKCPACVHEDSYDNSDVVQFRGD